MKTKNNLIFALLGGFSLLTAGCVKESDMNEKYRPEGTPIIFSAATGYENGDGTRTEYSGHFFNGSTEVTGNTLSSYANTWERTTLPPMRTIRFLVVLPQIKKLAMRLSSSIILSSLSGPVALAAISLRPCIRNRVSMETMTSVLMVLM